MNKIILIVLVGLLCLILGAGAGFWYKTLQVSPQIEKTAAIMKALSSKTVLSTVAYGKVSKIEGRDITLAYNGDSIKISMAANSPVYSFVNDSAGKPVQKKVDLREIKIGDNLNITIKLLPDGQIQGQSALILLSNKNNL
ncbi:MAG: hypothetical protein HY005_00320 [Candidatus Staskawiczbacteria bacterium]|nr:hypothetical protein [Candidatus Staskawiczbacteria bacterium]